MKFKQSNYLITELFEPQNGHPRNFRHFFMSKDC